MTDKEILSVGRNTKVTIGVAITLALTAGSGAWAVRDAMKGVEDEMVTARQELQDVASGLSDQIKENQRDLNGLKVYNQSVFKNRWTRDDTEIWWLRSERENPGGTGLIDPSMIKSGKEIDER